MRLFIFIRFSIFHGHIYKTWAYFITSLNFKLCKNKIICMSNLLFWRFQLSLAWWFRISSVSMSVSLLQTYLHSRLQLAIVCVWIEMVHLDTITISAQNIFSIQVLNFKRVSKDCQYKIYKKNMLVYQFDYCSEFNV